MKNLTLLFFRKINNNLISFLIFFGLLFPSNTFGQYLEGKILAQNQNKTIIPLAGATIRWQNGKGGEITDPDGFFKIIKNSENYQLIISLIGYKSDTLMIESGDFLEVILTESKIDLDGVTIRGNASVMDKLNPIQTEILTATSLKKAACCNLSESFETNATVTVSYGDAVTGSKKIQMLGLSGNYVQINTENMPSIRGLNTTFGLNYTPGTWIQSIDIGKGVGSVVNGYESMTGVINVELIKPENSDKIFINTYLNSQGRAELNVHLSDTLSKKWSVGVLSHISSQLAKIDGNKDNFLDIPLYKQINLLNRWKYQGEKLASQFGIKYLTENRLGGESKFNEKVDKFKGSAYGFGSNTNRVELFAKIAMLFPDKPYKGLGLITNGLMHKNDSYFGFKKYSGVEKSFYSNLIFQNIINNTNHSYRIGTSLLLDHYNEFFVDSTFKRNEIVPGIFAEYNFTMPTKFNLLLGQRVDFHNLYGNIYSPRIHLKYDLPKNTQVRFNIGTGWRMPNALAENFGNFVNSRQIKFLEVIRPEKSINFGGSLNKEFNWLDNKGSLILDFYRTKFKNQLVVDMETYNLLHFYNLKGQSFSNSFQAELNYSPKVRFDIKLAYRNVDIKNDMKAENGEYTLLPKMFVNRDRLLLNMAYATKWNKWKYDFTWQWNGKRRIPNSEHGHVHTISTLPVYAPSFSNINAQITKTFKNWELYLGGENLGNFKQKDPILNPQDPFGAHFDASMVWGPVAGRVIYSGIRWKIEKLMD